jgi:hypothetical protein
MENTNQNDMSIVKKNVEDKLKEYLTEIKKIKTFIEKNKECKMKGNNTLNTLGMEINELNRDVSYMRYNDLDHNKGKNIDNLFEDPIIPTQQWCCISFVSPEGLKNCNLRAVKIRGVYSTREEANKRAKFLQSIDPDFHIFVGELGKWLGWDPDPNSIEDQEYSDKKLQKLVSEYKKNRTKAKVMEEERKREILEENIRREASKTSKTKQQERMRKKLDQNRIDNKMKEMEENRLDPATYKVTEKPQITKNEPEESQELMKKEHERLLKKEEEIKKTVDNLSTVDDKINHLQQMYKDMLQKKGKQKQHQSVSLSN